MCFYSPWFPDQETGSDRVIPCQATQQVRGRDGTIPLHLREELTPPRLWVMMGLVLDPEISVPRLEATLTPQHVTPHDGDRGAEWVSLGDPLPLFSSQMQESWTRRIKRASCSSPFPPGVTEPWASSQQICVPPAALPLTQWVTLAKTFPHL